VATCENPLVKVLYIDCFCPPWIGTGNAGHKTIQHKEFSLKALMLSGSVNRYNEIVFQGVPQCIHFGPAGPEGFKVGHMVAQEALGLEEGTTSDAQLPLSQTLPATFLPDLRFYPVALKMVVQDEMSPARGDCVIFHKVTGTSVPNTMHQAGLVTSLAALFGHLQLLRGSRRSSPARRRESVGKQAGLVTALAALPWPFATSARLLPRTSRGSDRTPEGPEVHFHSRDSRNSRASRD
jgi:hypothetical protein